MYYPFFFIKYTRADNYSCVQLYTFGVLACIFVFVNYAINLVFILILHLEVLGKSEKWFRGKILLELMNVLTMTEYDNT